MKRLTKRYASHIAVVCDNCKEKGSYCDTSVCRDVMRNRLAEYEDAEEQGLLVRLPCKVGDTVWIKGDRFPAVIEEIRITDDGVYFAYVEYDKGYEETEVWDNGEFTLSDIGKTVFLTHEEAEKALEGNNGQK